MANTEAENKKLKKDLKEIKDLSKQYAVNLETVKALTAASAVNFQKILDLGKQNTAQAKKDKKLLRA